MRNLGEFGVGGRGKLHPSTTQSESPKGGGEATHTLPSPHQTLGGTEEIKDL